MLDLTERPKIGPYILTRELEPCRAFGRFGQTVELGEHGAARVAAPASIASLPQRFLALHADDHSSHVAYRFGVAKDASAERKFRAAVETIARVSHPHLLSIEEHGIDALGTPWLITPFTGDVDGLRTLARLLREKGGQMEPLEVERTMEQVLRAVVEARSGGMAREDGTAVLPVHGFIQMEQVLVNRRGAVCIELYGLARALEGAAKPSAELVRDEVRSVVEIAYQLITGLRADDPLIPAERLVPRLDRAWVGWLRRGLDPSSGFDTAVQALEALPSHVPPGERPSGVRGALSRLRALRNA